MSKVFHTLSPIYDENSKVLILGTMPSPKSREIGFYYGHPKNRFWPVFEDLFHVSLKTKEEKVKFLLDNHIALWDVVESCDIKGASDSSILHVIVNDIPRILRETKVKTIFSTGKKSLELYNRYIYAQTHVESIYLPSTSPANCRVKYEELIKSYQKVKEELEIL